MASMTKKELSSFRRVFQQGIRFTFHESFESENPPANPLHSIPKPDIAWFANFDPMGSKKISQKRKCVLTAEQEKALFIYYDYLKWQANNILTEFVTGKNPFNSEQQSLLSDALSKVENVRDIIIQHNLGLPAKYFVDNRKRYTYVDLHEWWSHLLKSLGKAIDYFDPYRGYKFSSFVFQCFRRDSIRLSERSALQHKRSTPMSLFEEERETNGEESIHDKSMKKPRIEISNEKLAEIIVENKANLTPVELKVIKLRYFEISHREPTFVELARTVSLDVASLKDVIETAFNKIRKYVSESGLI